MTKPDFTTNYLRGIEHFNALEFWEAHESWEELWLVADSEIEQYLQGLIQLAAAYHHVKRGTLRGAVRLFESALRRLDAFPRPFCATDRVQAEAAAVIHRQWAAAALESGDFDPLPASSYPKLALMSSKESPLPPYERW